MLARLDAAHARALRVVRTLTPAELEDRRYLDKVMDGSAAHFAMHLPEVRAAR